MGSKNSPTKPSSAGAGRGSANNCSKGAGSGTVESQVDQVIGYFAGLDTGLDDGGGVWEVFGKKNKNRNAGRGAGPGPRVPGRQEPQQPINLKGKATGSNWPPRGGDPRVRGYIQARPDQVFGRGRESAVAAPVPVIGPPLQHGWQWGAKAAAARPPAAWPPEDPAKDVGKPKNECWADAVEDPDSDTKDDDDEEDDSDFEEDDEILGEDFDSDESVKSHETRKKNRRFVKLFETIEKLTVKEISEPSRQWHCPVCYGGPGGIDWYTGMQALVTHAKTKGGKWMKLHRELGELLEEELLRRGSSVVPMGESFGKWEGLSNKTDRAIVWPPMVVIRNTILDKDDKDKWVGMGNQELLQYFESFPAVKARHSYGPQGHRGLSLLLFESTALGYLDAERLHQHFVDQSTDRDAWDGRRVLFHPGGGGKRQLYGYLATKEDLDYFNLHSHGKVKLKFEMRSYQEMVVAPMRQMSEDNQQLLYFKNKYARTQLQAKAMEQTMGVMTDQLRLANEERNIVKQRVKMQNEENKEEMDYMDKLFKEKIAVIYEEIENNEKAFEKSLQDERRKAQLDLDPSETSEDQDRRREEIAKLIVSQEKGVTEFEAEREKLMTSHKEKVTELKRRHYEEQVELEKEFGDAMTLLIKKYQPHL